MKRFENCELVELTDSKIVQEHRFGKSGNGLIRIVGNPNPPPEEHQKTVNKITSILFDYECRKRAKEKTG